MPSGVPFPLENGPYIISKQYQFKVLLIFVRKSHIDCAREVAGSDGKNLGKNHLKLSIFY